MSLATTPLPTDPEALQAFAARLQAELAARDAEIYAKTLHIEKLRATLELMKRARFGRSSERIEQLELLIGDLEEGEAEEQVRRDAAERGLATTRARRPRGRQPLPADLPCERVEHEPASACPACGSTKLGRIGALRGVGSPQPHRATSARCSNTCPRTSRWWSTSARS